MAGSPVAAASARRGSGRRVAARLDFSGADGDDADLGFVPRGGGGLAGYGCLGEGEGVR